MHHAELWGPRPDKYAGLLADDVSTTPWRPLAPQAPFYLFVPQDVDRLAEYEQGWKVTEVFPVNSVGIVTSRDGFVFDYGEASLTNHVQAFLDPALTDDQAGERFLSPGDKLPVAEVRKKLRSHNWQQDITSCLYRPFDVRSLLYAPEVIERSRQDVMRHMIAGKNLGLIFMRQVAVGDAYTHFGVSQALVDNRAFYSNKGIMSYAPLYLYPTDHKTGAAQASLLNTTPWPPDAAGRVPNLAPAFVAAVEKRTGLRFQSAQTLEVSETSRVLAAAFTPEDLFGYIYAIFHSPTYRSRYAEFLKIDFPRVPITSDPALFWWLAGLGRELVSLHLLDAEAAPVLLKPITRFPIPGDGLVARGHPRYVEANCRVYISADDAKAGKQGQYFEGVPPEVWDFQVGGYQPCQKWLKDRVGRQLTYDDLTHYGRMVVALHETIRLMAEIDAAIPGWPLI